MDVPRTLLVTNDYPPRVGGIQRTLEALVRCFPADRVAVLCPDAEGAAAFDEAAPYEVFRQPERFLWPVPDVRRRVHEAVRSFGAEVVLFGAVYPLALLGPVAGGGRHPVPRGGARLRVLALDRAGHPRAGAAGDVPGVSGAGDVQQVHRPGRPNGRAAGRAGLGDVPGCGSGGLPPGPAFRRPDRACTASPTAR